jgi:hypothetical protein
MKKLFLLGLMLVFLAASVACTTLFLFARYRVERLGLDAGRQPLAGDVPVRGIRTISVGMTLPRASLAQYLEAAGFKVSSDDTDKAGYSLAEDGGLALPGSAAVGTFRIHWRGSRIESIEGAGGQLEAIEIPSPVLFSLHDRDEDLGAFFSQRQFIADDAELKARCCRTSS